MPTGPTTPTGKTAASGGAGGALGVLFVIFFPMLTGIELTADQGALITGAISALAGFVWSQVEYYRTSQRGGPHAD